MARSLRSSGKTGTPTPVTEEQAPEETTPTGIQNDANSGLDVSANLESPYGIDYGIWHGTITEDNDGDAYEIRWSPGDTVNIIITPSRGLDISFSGASGGYSIDPRNVGLKGELESIQMTADISMNIRRIDILITVVSGLGITY